VLRALRLGPLDLISHKLVLGWFAVGRSRWRSLVSAALRTLFLLRLGRRGLGHIFVLGWLRLGDPGGEGLFRLRFGRRGLRRVFVLGWLRLGDPGGEGLFRLHFGPRGLRHVSVLG
jgi:hypothetical protein